MSFRRGGPNVPRAPGWHWVAFALALGATSAASPRPEATALSVRTQDVESVDAIIRAVYETISGPAGKRDWNRFRSLFAPGARLIPVRVGDDGADAMMLTVEDYIENSGAYFEKKGFFESEIARRTETFGHLSHALSTYESRHAPGEAPFARGINSFQLFHDGERWWIVTIFWDSERPEQPIPAQYLP